MQLLATIDPCPPRERSRTLHVPEARPSILDPCLDSEPWIDCCACCTESLALYLHNRPIAVIPGSSLECSSLNIRLNQLRHRNPRQ
jgi:hypothetical protein